MKRRHRWLPHRLRRALRVALTKLASLRPTPQARAERTYAAGRRLEDVHDTDRAIRAYSRAIALHPAPARYHRALARSFAAVGDWAGSARASNAAVARRARASDLYRLGTSMRKLGDWDAALNAYERAVQCSDARPKHHLWLGRALVRRGDLSAALDAFEAAVAGNVPEVALDALIRMARIHVDLDDKPAAATTLARARSVLDHMPDHFHRAPWLTRLGKAYALVGDREGASEAFQDAIGAEPSVAEHRLALGVGLHTLGDYAGALSALQEARTLAGDDPRIHFRLGLAHEAIATRAEPNPSSMGLLAGAAPEWEEAGRAYREAVRLDPLHPTYHYRLGTVLLKLGDAQGAVEAITRSLELDDSRPARHWRLGRAIADLAQQEGAQRPESLEASSQAYRRALQLDPDFDTARRHLVRTEIRRANWEAASRAAWYPEPRPDEGVASARVAASRLHDLRRYLESPRDGGDPRPVADFLADPGPRLACVPVEWWFPLHWRLLSEGRVRLAYRAKDAMAERIVQLSDSLDGVGLGRHLEVVSALTYLDRIDDARSYLDELQRSSTSQSDQLLIRKFAADVDITRGDVEGHAQLLDIHTDISADPAEQRFRSLIEGRRVAIVGPADIDLPNGQEIDDHDVVIRTKFVPETLSGHEETAGTRTDLSYYAIGGASLLTEEIRTALQNGHLQMVVFRPSAYRAGDDHILEEGDLRYMPSEYRASFRAAMFAIQRIVYDIIRYRPASIKVFNVNFFAARNEYRQGYRFTEGNSFEARGFVRPLRAFPHDFRSDFILTRRWVDAGLIEVDPVAAEVLSLDPEAYLEVLDRKRQDDSVS